jgi:mRNA interferase HigB
LRILSRHTLVEFWKKHPNAEQPLPLWFSMVQRAAWSGPAQVRAIFGSAGFLANNRIRRDDGAH